MWIDDQGVYHTAAVPDPAELMSEEFRRSLDRLLMLDPRGVAEAVDIEEMHFYEEGTKLVAQGSGEADFVGVAPPTDLMAEVVENVTDLRRLLHAIDDRWRLDALAALDDYIP